MSGQTIIALTGASGFLGRHTVSALVARGYRVRVLMRSGKLAKAWRKADIEMVRGALDDADALGRLTKGADAVVHLAGAIAAPDRTSFDAVNVAGTERLARIADGNSVKRFVHVSSLAAREPGLSDYGASKRASEKALRANCGSLRWSIVRPPAVYGPGDKGTLPLIAQLSQAHAFIPGNRETRTSLIYVEDLAQAVATLAGPDMPHGFVHELHDGKADGYTWTELAELAAAAQGDRVRPHFLPRFVMGIAAFVASGWARITGVPAMLNPGKVKELYHSDWTAKSGLLEQYSGWRPRVSFSEGFKRTLDWYRGEGWLPQGRLMQRFSRRGRGEWAA